MKTEYILKQLLLDANVGRHPVASYS